MKQQMTRIKLALGAAVLGLGLPAFGQAPVITSFSQSGQLVCSNLQTGTVASVEWASSLAGPWQTNWAGLDAVTVGTNGTIAVNVPMFYRVRGVAAVPAGMVLIPAGSFTMGDTFSEGRSEEFPLHTVYVSAFYVEKHNVTKALWEEVYTWAITNGYSFDNAGSGKAADHPVQTVNWYDSVKWCNARSEKEGRVPAYYTSAAQTTAYRTGQVNVDNDSVKWNAGYRLPTEAEREKAARGGANGQRFPWGNTITHDQANYFSTTNYAYDTSPTRGYHPSFQEGGTPYTSPVGYFAPNGYGLYDMSGNVRQWCWDWYGLYSSATQSDPCGPTSGSYRVLRGGSWYSNGAYFCRSAFRNSYSPDFSYNIIGFRAVLPPDQ